MRFSGRPYVECLNERSFPKLLHAHFELEIWRAKYNEERPAKLMGDLTPAAYAQQLAAKATTKKSGLQRTPLLKAGDVGCWERGLSS
ncbi:TPA: transposase [Stenotrophomonas maltophilia]|nr:transposase [Stenotrophomonas maltophilia]